MTGLQTLRPEYVTDRSGRNVRSSLLHSYLPGKSSNYNIKAVSTSDLFAFALYAITLNQERSVVDVGLMQNNFFFFILCWLFVHWTDEIQLYKHMEYHPRDFALDFVCIHWYDLNNMCCVLGFCRAWSGRTFFFFFFYSSLCGNEVLIVIYLKCHVW